MKQFGILLAASLLSSPIMAADGVSVELGNGDHTDIGRIGLLWDWQKNWLGDGRDWHITAFWEVAIAQWRGRSSIGDNQRVTDLGVTPVLRLEQKQPAGVSPYAEVAVGIHLVSPAFVSADRKLGSSFQFGDSLGLGLRFGDKRQFDVGYRYQHLSNGGIKQPNQGINLNELRFIYWF